MTDQNQGAVGVSVCHFRGASENIVTEMTSGHIPRFRGLTVMPHVEEEYRMAPL
jgi:hypothetical protein